MPDALVIARGCGRWFLGVRVPAWPTLSLLIVSLLSSACGNTPASPGATPGLANSERAATVAIVTPVPASGGSAAPAVGDPPTAALAVASFTMLEVQYPGSSDWYYAPRIEVRETSGESLAIVTRAAFSVPGLGPAPPVPLHLCVDRGAQIPLFGVTYGDYDVTVDQRGRRASGEPATAVLTFEDSAGRQATITATGPIVAGTLPPYISTAAPTCANGES